jgi:N-acetylglucosamine-6-sulfatase
MKVLFFFCFASVNYIFGVILPVPMPVIVDTAVADVVDAVDVGDDVDVVDADAAEHKPNKNNKPHQNKRKRKRKKKSNEKNNILLLLTDDQDILLGSFNTKKYMPIVHQQLIEMGVTFEQGALTHVPICCPSRSSILTGKYLHTQQGMALNNSVTGNCYGSEWKTNIELNSTYAVYAQQAGYTTIYAGKYLNQYKYNETSPESSIPNGWDYWYGLEGNSRYYNYSIVEHSPEMISRDGLITTIQIHQHSDTYPDDYLPLVLQKYTLEKLATLPEPWLAVIAWPTPHGPFTPEPKYEHDYPDVNPPTDMPNYNATEDSMNMKHWLLRQLGIITNETALQINDIYRNRLRTLKTVDTHIGSIIKLLKKMKQKTTTTVSTSSSSTSSSISSSTTTSSVLDRTVIIYTSDNGFQFGQHRLAIDKVRIQILVIVLYCTVLYYTVL